MQLTWKKIFQDKKKKDWEIYQFFSNFYKFLTKNNDIFKLTELLILLLTLYSCAY